MGKLKDITVDIGHQLHIIETCSFALDAEHISSENTKLVNIILRRSLQRLEVLQVEENSLYDV